jgi:anti-sigma regulatory factor (Ser/Thr protein kinase)
MCCDSVIGDPAAFSDGEGKGGVSAHCDLPPEPESAAAGRSFVSAQVGDYLSPEERDTAVLLASELITNAILHARTPLQVGVTCWPRRVMVSVGDRNLLRPEQQPYSEERTGGRGLGFVDALAHRWGVTEYEGGKTTWFIVDEAGPAKEERG